ncbi:hypothetical protein AB71190_03642 [Acinetobacter baumannii]|nr:hypothetical protein [Acinetobacter baumannii]KAF0598744.1 hypothetical protein AB71190_03642 [Acinetobacter baumannii]
MDKKVLLEQFESLPLMVAILNDSFIFVEQSNEYAHQNLENNRVTLGYVNGAWYAFQHQQAKVEEMQKQLIEHGLICPMCGITGLKEDSFLNGEIECLISVCTECGIETASIPQMKINKLANLNAELQKRVNEQGLIIAKVMSIASDLQQSWAMFEIGKKLEQALKGEATPNINIDEKGECRHFSTTMFSNGKAECFHCDAIVNEKREVIGKQSKGFSCPSKEGDQ